MYDQITLKLNVDPFILGALKEDITSEDVSTNSVMPEACMGKVELICKQDGIICGLQVFKRVFELLDDTTVTELYCKDGDEVKAGQLMGVVTGDIRVLLSGERTALNYLQRMSGIATYTHKVAGLLAGSKIQLLDTRKTTPNNRIFEKYAVRVGGGHNHRYNLSDKRCIFLCHTDCLFHSACCAYMVILQKDSVRKIISVIMSTTDTNRIFFKNTIIRGRLSGIKQLDLAS